MDDANQFKNASWLAEQDHKLDTVLTVLNRKEEIPQAKHSCQNPLCASLRARLEQAERERDEARAELERFKKNWFSARSELEVSERAQEQLRAELDRVQGEAAALRQALEWYLKEDEESVQYGILEDVSNRPAHRAISSTAGADLLAEVKRLREVLASRPSLDDWEYCPKCGGSLDTGWECVKCGTDWVNEVS